MNPRHSYAYLDGVRGWAALMVVYGHFIAAMQPAMLGMGAERTHFAGDAWLGQSGLIMLYNPQLAVDVFFVLSGFVLATSVNNRPASFIELAVRRWVRLGLPILGTTAMVMPLVNWHLFPADAAGALTKSDWMLLCYNWSAWPTYPYLTVGRLFWQSLVAVFINSHMWYNPALWTMKMEFYGSMGLFAGYTLLPGGFLRRGGGLLVALVAAGLACKTPLLSPFTYGIALYEVVRLIRQQPEPFRARLARASTPGAIVLLLASLALGGIPYDLDLPDHGFYARLAEAAWPWVGGLPLLTCRLSALCLVAAALLWQPLQRLLMTKPSQWLGRVSFSLYLVHAPILCALGGWLLLWLAPLVGYNPATLLVLPMVLAVTLPMAELIARLLDIPAIRLSRPIGAAAADGLRRLLGIRAPVASAH